MDHKALYKLVVCECGARVSEKDYFRHVVESVKYEVMASVGLAEGRDKRCLHPMPSVQSVCWRRSGHALGHRSREAMQRDHSFRRKGRVA